MKRYTLEERNHARFVKTPKDFFINSCYRNILTSDAKLVYSLLLDRMELSRENEWINENNEIYLLFTKENIAEYLGISKRTIYKAFKALERCNLIEQERQGLNKPNKIFIGKTNADFAGNCNFCRSEPEECAGQELQIFQGNDTELNETESSETEKTYIEPKNSSVAMSSFLSFYKTYTGEKHKAVEEYTYRQVEELLSLISTEEYEVVINGQLKKFFDNFDYTGNRRPTLNYFLRVAGTYFEEEFKYWYFNIRN